MSPVILIMAAGPAWRGWTAENPKQLALIAGEPLILRTLRMLNERGHKDTIVVTHNAAIQNTVPTYFDPPKHRYWYETLLSTRLLWGERTIVFNGDTIYSPEVLDTVLADQSRLMFFGKFDGNMSHLNAMAFDASEHGRITSAAKKTIQAVLKKRGGRIQHSWGLYYYLHNLPLRNRNAPTKSFCAQAADDYTCDIDKPEKYMDFLKRHTWARGT